MTDFHFCRGDICSDDTRTRYRTVKLDDGTFGVLVTGDMDNVFQADYWADRMRHHLEGRTYGTGRCNCYRGHSSNSGRCYAGQGGTLWTTPERQGICDDCWDNCGHAAEHESTHSGTA